jgi:hypothetical protein
VCVWKLCEVGLSSVEWLPREGGAAQRPHFLLVCCKITSVRAPQSATICTRQCAVPSNVSHAAHSAQRCAAAVRECAL